VVAHGHLAVGDQYNFVVLAHAQYRCAMRLRASLTGPHPFIIRRKGMRAKTQACRSAGESIWSEQSHLASRRFLQS
jgi:hypothetical protein